MANGLFSLVHHLITPATLAIIVAALSLTWLARIEVDEYDRRGTKPHVETH
jgi:hypothetical protein